MYSAYRNTKPAISLLFQIHRHCPTSKGSATIAYTNRGEVSERLKELASKASVGGTLPWVRIPPSPPLILSTWKQCDSVSG
jgi:hypothetical protein